MRRRLSGADTAATASQQRARNPIACALTRVSALLSDSQAQALAGAMR